MNSLGQGNTCHGTERWFRLLGPRPIDALFWIALSAFAYNLFGFILPEEFGSAQPPTVRYRLFAISARMTRHARQTVVKMHHHQQVLLDRRYSEPILNFCDNSRCSTQKNRHRNTLELVNRCVNIALTRI